MRKDKWGNILVIIFMIFVTSLMYTLKTYQVLGSGMLKTKNGIIFTTVTIILAIMTIITFATRLKIYKK